MKRIVLMSLLIAVGVIFAGCSKDTEKDELRKQVTALEEKVSQLEAENKDLKGQVDQAALKLTDAKRQGEDLQQALEVRLLHQPLSEFTISPAVTNENGWLLLDGEHTFTLTGHSGATKVVFYWAESTNDFRPQELGVDSNGKDGWSWTGSLPPGHMRAFWAKVHYPGGIEVMSGVLPLRSTGK